MQLPYRQLLAAHHDLAYIYTIIEQNQKFYFIIDTQVTHPGEKDDTAEIMEEYTDISIEAVKALQTKMEQVGQKPYTDKWGTFLSGYAPIYNSAKQLIGVVGVDIRMENYQQKLMDV